MADGAFSWFEVPCQASGTCMGKSKREFLCSFPTLFSFLLYEYLYYSLYWWGLNRPRLSQPIFCSSALQCSHIKLLLHPLLNRISRNLGQTHYLSIYPSSFWKIELLLNSSGPMVVEWCQDSFKTIILDLASGRFLVFFASFVLVSSDFLAYCRARLQHLISSCAVHQGEANCWRACSLGRDEMRW